VRLLAGNPTVDDPDVFLETLRTTAGNGDVVVQAFDGRYVAGRSHLERAVDLARRERDRGEAIADTLAVEVLCYAAGRRQIDDALAMGVGPSTDGVVVVLLASSEAADDRDEQTAALDRASERCQERFDLADPAQDSTAQAVLASTDEARLTSFFDVSPNERTVALAGFPELVAERVALLVVDR
jgi:KEOPS complex subunit Cgi121